MRVVMTAFMAPYWYVFAWIGGIVIAIAIAAKLYNGEPKYKSNDVVTDVPKWENTEKILDSEYVSNKLHKSEIFETSKTIILKTVVDLTTMV